MAHRHQKRLIVCCDGTWMDSDNGFDRKTNTIQVPSNVTRLVRAIRTNGISHDPANRTADYYIPQITYYQAGVGTGVGVWDHVVGGGTGAGLSEHIREAYAFLADNWEAGDPAQGVPPDEIFLIGFSRGAFTARSIAGFIGHVGLLNREGMQSFYEIFKDYENANVEGYVPAFPNVPFPEGKPSMGTPQGKKEYQDLLVKHGLSRLGIPIKAVGVWDTVGSLGIPTVSWVDKLHLPFPSSKELLFYDTKLDNVNIEYAFQALALDEMRFSFPPAIWELPDGSTAVLKQTWFPGVHANIGGGMDDQQLSDITLAWMLSQLDPLLDFDEQYVLSQFDLTVRQEELLYGAPRPYSFGNIETTSNSKLYVIAGDHSVRTPGQYREVPNPMDPSTTPPGSLPPPLKTTNEHIHASVRIRLGLHGPGINDDKTTRLFGLIKGNARNPGYGAEALTRGDERVGWRCVGVRGDAPSISSQDDGGTIRQGQAEIYWVPGDEKFMEEEGFARNMVLREDVMGRWELMLLRRYPDVWRDILKVSPEMGGFGKS